MQAPKRKTSKSKRNMRRAHHGLSTPTSIACPQCGSYVVPHRMCTSCGTYRGRKFRKVAAESEA